MGFNSAFKGLIYTFFFVRTGTHSPLVLARSMQCSQSSWLTERGIISWRTCYGAWTHVLFWNLELQFIPSSDYPPQGHISFEQFCKTTRQYRIPWWIMSWVAQAYGDFSADISPFCSYTTDWSHPASYLMAVDNYYAVEENARIWS